MNDPIGNIDPIKPTGPVRPGYSGEKKVNEFDQQQNKQEAQTAYDTFEATVIIRNILCPIDFSETMAFGLRYGNALAEFHKADLHIISVYVNDDSTDTSRIQHEEGILRRLRMSMEVFDPRLYTTVCKVLWGDPTLEIINYTKNYAIDLIIMPTHGRGMVEKFMMGSVTEKVIAQAPCPVLTMQANSKHFFTGQ